MSRLTNPAKLQLPKAWTTGVRSAVLHVKSLARPAIRLQRSRASLLIALQQDFAGFVDSRLPFVTQLSVPCLPVKPLEGFQQALAEYEIQFFRDPSSFVPLADEPQVAGRRRIRMAVEIFDDREHHGQHDGLLADVNADEKPADLRVAIEKNVVEQVGHDLIAIQNFVNALADVHDSFLGCRFSAACSQPFPGKFIFHPRA